MENKAPEKEVSVMEEKKGMIGIARRIASSASKLNFMNVLCDPCKNMLVRKVAARGTKDPQSLMPEIKYAMCETCKQKLNVEMRKSLGVKDD